MPYIRSTLRKHLQPELENLCEKLRELPDRDQDGAFNYCITKIALNMFGKYGYSQFIRVSGGFVNALLEFYRRVASPYEDGKLKEQGEVYNFED